MNVNVVSVVLVLAVSKMKILPTDDKLLSWIVFCLTAGFLISLIFMFPLRWILFPVLGL